MNFRTDLAIELAEQIGNTTRQSYQTDQQEEDGTIVSHTKILTPEGEKQFGKPVGDYITVEVAPFSDSVTDSAQEAEVIARQIRLLLPEQDGLVLVVGLGNLSVTPDALGPRVIDGILATRHLAGEWERVAGQEQLRPVAAMAPGVLGQTGIETSEIIACLCEKIKPSCVIVIDALAARSLKRLGRTVQLSNTGISPGSGAMNRRRELSRKTLGAPVISMGVPTVADGVTVGCDLLAVEGLDNEEAARTLFAPEGQSMLVTPKEIDLLIGRASKILAMAINRALQPSLSQEELSYFVS
ncbi:MAG: GPR endopeptidase [Oscillospiraceae bacterium]|nr:GPR endopeptidase [Oscillospiraceae bacterium]